MVDDGIATGSTMSAAVALLRHQRAKNIVVAVPIAPRDTVHRLRDEADEVIALINPIPSTPSASGMTTSPRPVMRRSRHC